MHKSLLMVPLFAAACSFPKFQAGKTIELDVPLEQAARLACETHNGHITVSPGASDDRVQVRAEMRVRGMTQDEADANLHLLSVGHDVDGDQLRIYGQYPKAELINRSPSFTFTLKVPPRLLLQLESHNGDITATGTRGAVSIETHNGDIGGSFETGEASIETHNGNVHVQLNGAGELATRVVTHNGNVAVEVGDDASGWVEAHTHNGRIKPPSTIHDATMRKRSLRCRLGDRSTEGKLYLQTHNGNIRITTAPEPDVK